MFDGMGGRTFGLPPLPREIWTGRGGPSHGLSPNCACIIDSLWSSGFGDSPGATWIALLEGNAEWTVVSFEIYGWLKVPEG